MIRVMIVDDHSIVRKGLRQLISESPGMVIVGEGNDYQSGLEVARHKACDVAVIDISLPGRGGLELLKELRSETPSLHVIILSIHPEEAFAIRAMRDGARAYITKSSATDELVKAIETVATGKRYVTSSLAEKLVSFIEDDPGQDPHHLLSDREFQVFLFLTDGLSNGEIGERLGISVKTVSTYRKRILEKMNMEKNIQLIHYAIDHNLQP